MAGVLDILREKSPIRGLALLAAATAISVIAAAIAVTTRESAVRPAFEPRLLFEELGGRVNTVSKIVYTIGLGLQGTSKITLDRKPDGTWGVAERMGYPANFERVKKTIIGMSELEVVEPRTAQPTWHRNLGLLAPEDLGSAVRIELLDADGERLGALLAGKVQEPAFGGRGGPGFIYVRKDGEDQSWLARGKLSLAKSVSDWLDPALMNIDRARIRRAILWAGTENESVLSRPGPDVADFSLESLPQGRETRGAPIVNASATAIVDLAFEDVVPASELDFPDTSPQVVFETFDGLRVRATLTGGAGGLWAAFEAETDAGLAPDDADLTAVAVEAEEINTRVEGWAYKLGQRVGAQMTQTPDLLTREATGEAAQ